MCITNIGNKKAEEAILISDQVHFRASELPGIKRGISKSKAKELQIFKSSPIKVNCLIGLPLSSIPTDQS